jgi:hypothetical protein
MTEREAFENYMKRQNPCVRLYRHSYPGTDYRTITVERAWKLWRAAWATANYEAKKPEGAEPMPLPNINPELIPSKEKA